MKIRKFAAALAAFAAIGGAASAQVVYDIKNPSATVRNFDAANLGTVLTDLGLAYQLGDVDGNGQQEFRVVRDNFIFFVVPTACLANGTSNCVGAHIFAFFTTSPVNQQTINAFNIRFPFVSTGPLPNGFYVARYEIADFGIARGNVESSLDSFYDLAGEAFRQLGSSSQTVSAEGFADDMAASLLNEASARASGLAPANADGQATHLHQIRVLADRVRAFADAATPTDYNKIENTAAK